VNGIGVPAFRIDAPQAVMALAGILRPRLLVTRGLIDALTPEELAAAIAHEVGHHRAWDNLKRLAMLGAPDVLRWTPAAHRLEHQWAAAAEHIADAAAAHASGGSARLALASALVKVARLMPPPTPVTEPISTLIGGGEIASRVQRLIDDCPEQTGSRRQGAARARWAAAAAAVAVAFGYAPLLKTVHDATEILVHYLP
jgi:Zn-dependent protease with chaperone function